jgi:hypothetical protein
MCQIDVPRSPLILFDDGGKVDVLGHTGIKEKSAMQVLGVVRLGTLVVSISAVILVALLNQFWLAFSKV